MIEAKTIKELKKHAYKAKTIKQEIRTNLVENLKNGVNSFTGIVGFEDSVIPQLENAILAGQDVILLGERGQAKTRILRSLTNLLDEKIPYISSCEIHCDPVDPICTECKILVKEEGESVEIAWLDQESRFSEKLATPDVSVGDLVGEIDPIKIAEGRHLSDERAIHYGMIPRSHRGIFCINELPDLSERIQVSLFNLLQERDIQIKGYQFRLPLDIFLVATANPEDYTNRGRIITPLKDRYGAQIRTHYPDTILQEIAIVDQERKRFEDLDAVVLIPDFVKKLLVTFTHLARQSPEVNQRSGVSLRVSIANYETLMAQTYKRAIKQSTKASPRISDMDCIISSTMGKLELETVEEGKEADIIRSLMQRAIQNIFAESVDRESLEPLITSMNDGLVISTGPELPDADYMKAIESVPGLRPILERLVDSSEDSSLASGLEFILEGLHLNRLVNKSSDGQVDQYLQG